MEEIVLDTDIISNIFKNTNDWKIYKAHLANWSFDNIFTTRINFCESRRGFNLATKSETMENLMQRTMEFYWKITILEVTESVIFTYLRIRDLLKGNNRTVEWCDLLIASIVIEKWYTLITKNIKHFKVIPELKYENWKNKKTHWLIY
jgi:predicted nucleic acid-binding protein